MIQQVNNKSVRSSNLHEPDIQFLKEYYNDHGEFPRFTQVLIETRTTITALSVLMHSITSH